MLRSLLVALVVTVATSSGTFCSDGELLQPAWLHGLHSSKPFLDYSQCHIQTYHCEERVRPLSEATTWSGQGRSVQALKVRLFDRAVVFLLELSEDDCLGSYNYCMGFSFADHGVWVHMNVARNEARVEHTHPSTGGGTVGYLAPEDFVFEESSLACQLHFRFFESFIPPSAIEQAWFSVALETVWEHTDESFRFPEECATKGEIES